MKLSFLLACGLLGGGFAAPAEALALQARSATETLSLRVSATGPGSNVSVDRGASDGVAVGDVVQLFPREGPVLRGSVTQVGERIAVVRLDVRGEPPPVGTRGEIEVPMERFARPAVEPNERADAGPPADADELPAERPPWENSDDEWTPGQPLLADVSTVPPYDRAAAFSGRLYVIGDRTRTSDSRRSDFFVRTGADLLWENAFGFGGRLNIDFELNRRQTVLPDAERENELDLRFDRLSYTIGGTRHAPERLQMGRFLQHGVPEFGVLDGIEYSRRIDSGDRFGVAVGFLPEPLYDFDTLTDFQIASYYRWVKDSSEQLAITAGVQSTLNNGTNDRDLFLAKVEYLPLDSWQYYGTFWVDYFNSDDEIKSGLQLTQAVISANRRWASGDDLRIFYTHYEWPELLRNEFRPVTPEQLADDHNDRISVAGTRALARFDVNAAVGAWADEDESGGDVQLGIDCPDLFANNSRTTATTFASQGEFSSVLGARVSYGQPAALGRWDVLYEAAIHDNTGFSADTDDIIQHWVKANHDFHTLSGWYINTSAQFRLWDDEAAWIVGAYLSKAL